MTIEELKNILSYNSETGVFTWKERDSGYFKTMSAYKAWAGKFPGTKAGSVSAQGYRIITINKKTYYQHRLAWLFTYSELPSKSIDHINGDRLDNRIVNLRDVSASENSRNSFLYNNNSSGQAGVSFHKSSQLWRAFIRNDGNVVSLGYFKNKDQAIVARKAAEKKYNYSKTHGSKRIGCRAVQDKAAEEVRNRRAMTRAAAKVRAVKGVAA